MILFLVRLHIDVLSTKSWLANSFPWFIESSSPCCKLLLTCYPWKIVSRLYSRDSCCNRLNASQTQSASNILPPGKSTKVELVLMTSLYSGAAFSLLVESPGASILIFAPEASQFISTFSSRFLPSILSLLLSRGAQKKRQPFNSAFDKKNKKITIVIHRIYSHGHNFPCSRAQCNAET